MLSPDPGLGLSAPVPKCVFLKGSTLITRAKNCIVMSCCCDHILEWELWCLTLKIQDNSRFLGSGGEPEKQVIQDKSSEGTECSNLTSISPEKGGLGTPPLWQVVFGSWRAADI